MFCRFPISLRVVLVAQFMTVAAVRAGDFKFHCHICGSTSHAAAAHDRPSSGGSGGGPGGESSPSTLDLAAAEQLKQWKNEEKARDAEVLGPVVSQKCLVVLWETMASVQRFDDEVTSDGRALLRDRYLELIARPIADRWKNDDAPVGLHRNNYRETARKIDDWRRSVDASLRSLKPIEDCLGTTGCSLIDKAREVEGAVRAWLETLAPVSDAADRVRSASVSLHKYADQLQVSFQQRAAATASCARN